MGIFAHPDDAELLCYGLLKRLALTGANITVVIATNGENGVPVGKPVPPGLPLIRMRETQSALAGVAGEIFTLSLPDGRLNIDSETVTAIETVLMRQGPDMVISHHMDGSGTDHNDHRVIGATVRNICFRKPFVKTLLSCEPIRPHTDFIPNAFVDVSAHFAEKCEAIAYHETQTERVYLTESYQRTRASRWSELSFAEAEAAPRLYEAFRLEKMVVS